MKSAVFRCYEQPQRREFAGLSDFGFKLSEFCFNRGKIQRADYSPMVGFVVDTGSCLVSFGTPARTSGFGRCWDASHQRTRGISGEAESAAGKILGRLISSKNEGEMRRKQLFPRFHNSCSHVPASAPER